MTDAYSRKIVGWQVHDSLETEPVAQALHQRHGLQCSMIDGYDCYQNALAKRVN